MISFYEWAICKFDEAARKGGKRQVPVAHHDIDKWLQSIELLKKDLEELKKAKKIAAQRLARTVAIKKAEPKKPEPKKPEPKKPEIKKPEEPKKPEPKKPQKKRKGNRKKRFDASLPKKRKDTDKNK